VTFPRVIGQVKNRQHVDAIKAIMAKDNSTSNLENVLFQLEKVFPVNPVEKWKVCRRTPNAEANNVPRVGSNFVAVLSVVNQFLARMNYGICRIF
jgi:hypothetical protein